MNALECTYPGVDWDFSQIIRDNVMEALSGVKGENSIKIFGPDLDRLEELAAQSRPGLPPLTAWKTRACSGSRGNRISSSPSTARNVLDGT